jgi:hypothetical protein
MLAQGKRSAALGHLRFEVASLRWVDLARVERAVGRRTQRVPRLNGAGPPQRGSPTVRNLPLAMSLTVMPFGNSAKALSRRDVMRIARRFNAGNEVPNRPSPEGTIEPWHCGASAFQPSLRDSSFRFGAPALKRWAIGGCPSGTANLCAKLRIPERHYG